MCSPCVCSQSICLNFCVFTRCVLMLLVPAKCVGFRHARHPDTRAPRTRHPGASRHPGTLAPRPLALGPRPPAPGSGYHFRRCHSLKPASVSVRTPHKALLIGGFSQNHEEHNEQKDQTTQTTSDSHIVSRKFEMLSPFSFPSDACAVSLV